MLLTVNIASQARLNYHSVTQDSGDDIDILERVDPVAALRAQGGPVHVSSFAFSNYIGCLLPLYHVAVYLCSVHVFIRNFLNA